MSDFCNGFQRLPDHCIEFIINTLPLSTLQSLISNGSSPFQEQFKRAFYRNVIVTNYSGKEPRIDLGFLKETELFNSLDVITAPFDCETLYQHMEKYPYIHIQNATFKLHSSTNSIDWVQKLADNINKIHINFDPYRYHDSFLLDLCRKRLPSKVFGLSTKYVKDMLFPFYLQSLELHLTNDEFDVKSLPQHLEHLAIHVSRPMTLLSEKELNLLPRQIRSLSLDKCFRIVEEYDGLVKLDLPTHLTTLKLQMEYSGKSVIDISHLRSLNRFDSHLSELQLSYMKLPIQLNRIRCKGSFLDTEQFLDGIQPSLANSEHLANLTNVDIWDLKSESCITIPDTVRDVSIISANLDSPLQLVITFPEGLSQLQLDYCRPVEMTQELRHLTSLKIFGEEIIFLPRMDNLQKLMIHHLNNLFPGFWDFLESLKELQFLEISGFGIETVQYLPHKLEELVLNDNVIKEFCFELPPNIKSISLRMNKLSKFIVSGTSKLKKLILDDNLFKVLTASCLQIPDSICELSMDFCHITSVDKHFNFPESTRLLRLSNNRIENVENILLSLPPRIVCFNLSRYDNRSRTPVTRKRIDVRSKSLWNVDVNNALMGHEVVWNGCTNLQYINLANNLLGNVDTNCFPLSLKGIKFNHSTIDKLEGGFERFADLEEADLRNCSGEFAKTVTGLDAFGPKILVTQHLEEPTNGIQSLSLSQQ